VHGSAPDIHGQNIANPVAMIWSGALMLEFLGCRNAHDAIVGAIERVLADGPRSGFLGGAASTSEVGKGTARLVRARLIGRSGAGPDVVRGMRRGDAGIQERNFLKVGEKP
jgi:hypothetical protein